MMQPLCLVHSSCVVAVSQQPCINIIWMYLFSIGCLIFVFNAVFLHRIRLPIMVGVCSLFRQNISLSYLQA